MDASIAYRRLRAPKESGGTLIEPPLTEAADVVTDNLRRRTQKSVDLQGRSLDELADSARQELIREARRYTQSYRPVGDTPSLDVPFFLAGHQPQIFHPGVWFKNFVLGELASQHHGVAVNLLIDSDTIKAATLAVPGGSLADPLVEMMPFDGSTAEIPYEQRTIVDRALLASFGERAARRIAPFVADPLVHEYWPLVMGRAKENNNLGQCIAQARHQLEGKWGLSTLELPQSRVCQFEAFHWFTVHLLAHLPRLREIYNAGLSEYRRVNHVRSVAHPAPNLAVEGDWLEAPFWIWQDADPRRRRLFVRRRDDQLLLSDRAGLEISLPLSADGDPQRAVEQLADLPQRGIKLRTRALITTMFARLVLGDLFLHGIGGAKYDQLTDSLIARFFDLTPPEFMVVSATVRLPIPEHASPGDELREVEHKLRDLGFNPERYLTSQPGSNGSPGGLVTAKQRLLATPAQLAGARQRCHDIRRLNEELQPWVAELRQQLTTRSKELTEATRADRVLSSRDYGFCLHSKKNLCKLLLAFREVGT